MTVESEMRWYVGDVGDGDDVDDVECRLFLFASKQGCRCMNSFSMNACCIGIYLLA